MRFIFILFFFIGQTGYSQSPYNHRLENGQIQAIGQLIHEQDNSYLGLGRGIDTIDFLRGIYATEFDKETGELLNTDKVTFPNSILFFSRGNSTFDIGNDPYFIFNSGDTIYLSKYSTLDKKIIIRKKIYSKDPETSLFIYDFYFKNDKFYVLSEHYTSEPGVSKPVLFTYNLNTDLLTEFFLICSDEFIKNPRIQIIQNGNFLVTYSIKVGNENIQYLEEIDQDGNSIWKYVNENKRESFVNSFIPMSDSTFILGGVKTRDELNSKDDEVIPFAFKFNYNQKKITARCDFEIPDNEWFWLNGTVEEIVPSHDGKTFFCVSELYDFPLNPDTLKSYGMIAKVDHDLNLIWRRQYAYIDGEYRNHDFEDIIATSDGNYLAYGTSIKTFSFPGEIPILSWVVKIDENGKIVGDTTTATVEWEIQDLADEIEIFPNPATDYIYINQNDIDHVSYKVYNLSGRLIDEFSISNKNQSTVKSILNWMPGYYIIKMKKNGKPIGSLKLLKV